MKNFFVSIALLISGIVVNAQPTWKNISDTRYVLKMIPDGDKLWLSSDGGLMCINHSTVDTTFYNNANSDMPFTEISDMCLDKQGRLWLTSSNAGIALKDGENWTAINTTNTVLPNNKAYSITCDPQGNIWTCLNDNLMKFDGNNWTAFDISFIGSSYGPDQIDVDANGRILMNGNGLWAFDGNSFVQYDTSNSELPDNRINFIKTFPDGKTWIGHLYSGLSVTDFTTWAVYDTLVPGRALSSVSSFDCTPDGKYWLGSGNDLYYFNGISWSLKFPEYPADSLFGINCLAVDDGNNLFVSGYNSAMFDGNFWYRLNTRESAFPGNAVYSIFHASDNTSWIGNYYGMTHFSGNSITNYNHDDSSAYFTVLSYAEDRNGKLYAGHYNGVTVFENNSWHHVSIPPGPLFSNISAYNICFDSDNNLWIATFPGLVKFDGTNTTYYSLYLNNFPASEVKCLDIDANGNIIAGINGGITYWNGNKWITKLIPDPVYDDKVWDLVVIGDIIWMATTGGLVKYDGTNWTYFTPDNSPLPNSFIRSMDCDANGNLWMINGPNTIVKFDGQNWQVLNFFETGMLYGPQWCLRVDNQDNVWLGGHDCGISIYNENGIYLNTSETTQTYNNQNFIKLVYPNPTSGEIKISYQLPDDQTGWIMHITDLQGKNVDSFPLKEKEGTYIYPAGKLSTGMYYFSVGNGKSVLSTSKVQVIR